MFIISFLFSAYMLAFFRPIFKEITISLRSVKIHVGLRTYLPHIG